MPSHETRREPGTTDPAAATEASQVPSEKPTPSKLPESDCAVDANKKPTKKKCGKKHPDAKSKKSKTSKKKKNVQVSDSDSDTSSDDAVSSSDSSDDDDESESEVEPKKPKRIAQIDANAGRAKKASLKKKSKKGKAKVPQASSSESSSDEASDGEEGDEEAVHGSKSDKKKRQSDKDKKQDITLQQLQQLAQLMLQNQSPSMPVNPMGYLPSGVMNPDPANLQAAIRSPFLQHLINTQLNQVLQNTGGQQAGRSEDQAAKQRRKQKTEKPRNIIIRPGRRSIADETEKASGNGLEFKRVDQVWDSSIHNYKLKDTTESPVAAKYEGFLFHVRRTFDWEGKYKTTYVDIKSKELRECLREVIGNIKGVSLVEETPKLDPNLLFL